MTSILPEKTDVSANQTRAIVPLDGWMDRAPITWQQRVMSKVLDCLTSLLGTATENPAPADDVDHDRFARGEVHTPGGYVYRSTAEVREVMAEYGLGLTPGSTIEDLPAGSPRRRQLFTAREMLGWDATSVCPGWCETFHRDVDELDMHEHCGFQIDVMLNVDEGTSRVGGEMTSVGLNLIHNYTDAEPIVQMSPCTDRGWVDMTLDEATSMAHYLLEMVEAAKETARATCEHDFPVSVPASGAMKRALTCTKCGAPRSAKSGRNMFDDES